MDKSTRRPIIDPLLLALKSRRVLVTICALLLALILTQIPALADYAGELLAVLVVMALAVIGGYSLEDAARAARETQPSDLAPDDLLRRVIREIIDELANQPEE